MTYTAGNLVYLISHKVKDVNVHTACPDKISKIIQFLREKKNYSFKNNKKAWGSKAPQEKNQNLNKKTSLGG